MKKYKVHMNFDVDYMTQEEPCRCTASEKNIFSNISDIYRHLRNNRESIRKKCSKKKCERLVDNVNNLKTSVNFIKDANITILEEMVDLLKNSSTAGYEDLHRIKS